MGWAGVYWAGVCKLDAGLSAAGACWPISLCALPNWPNDELPNGELPNGDLNGLAPKLPAVKPKSDWPKSDWPKSDWPKSDWPETVLEAFADDGVGLFSWAVPGVV